MKISEDIESLQRHAVRILFILYFCHDDPPSGTTFQLPLLVVNEDAVCTIKSELKVQKIDFWIRYPDHLAAALVEECKPGGTLLQRKNEVKKAIRNIFSGNEPEIHWVPMRRYLRGAYEPLDDVMSFLTSRWLAYRRVNTKGRRNTCYHLTQKGYKVVTDMLKACPETGWYERRCKQIQSFFGGASGGEIKDIQYLQDIYKNTPYEDVIDRVEAEVRSNFKSVFGEPL